MFTVITSTLTFTYKDAKRALFEAADAHDQTGEPVLIKSPDGEAFIHFAEGGITNGCTITIDHAMTYEKAMREAAMVHDQTGDPVLVKAPFNPVVAYFIDDQVIKYWGE